MRSPTQRTLEKLRGMGWTAAVVERWNPHAGARDGQAGEPTGIRQDLFGFADILAVRGDRPGTLYIQCTSLPHLVDRMDKLRANPAVRECILAGNPVEVWGWFHDSRHWYVRRATVRLRDLVEPQPAIDAEIEQ